MHDAMIGKLRNVRAHIGCVVVSLFATALTFGTTQTLFAQQLSGRFGLAPKVGVAVPAGELAKLVDPGTSVGVDLEYALVPRVTARITGAHDVLRGSRLSSGRTAPDLKVRHFTAGIEALLVTPQRVPLAVTADFGVGRSMFVSDKYQLQNASTAGTQQFREDYPTLSAGLEFGYALRPSMSLFVDGQAYWTFMKEYDTRRLSYLDIGQVRPFSNAVSIPVALGLRARI